MLSLVNSRVTYVWLFLAALTAASWILGDSYDPSNPGQIKYLTVGLLALAFFKIRLVVIHFMEIGHAPIPLRLVLEGWILLVFSLMVLLYFLA